MKVNQKCEFYCLCSVFFVALFLTPIRFYLLNTSLFFDLIILPVIFCSFFKKSIGIEFIYFIFLFSILSLIIFLNSLFDGFSFSELLSYFRQYLLPFFYAFSCFKLLIYMNDDRINKLCVILLVVISFDILLSNILYYNFYYPNPELLYPWSSVNSYSGTLNLNVSDPPTLFAYPYLHTESFLFGVFSLFYSARIKNKLYFLLFSLFIMLSFRVSTSILAFFTVLLVYILILKPKYIMFFIMFFIFIFSYLWVDYIQPVLIFYDYFSSDVALRILGLDKLEEILIFFNSSPGALFFGTFDGYVLDQKNGLLGEVGYINNMIRYGLIWCFTYISALLFVFFINMKVYFKTKDSSFLCYALIPMYILIDSIHYTNIFKVQTASLTIMVLFYTIYVAKVKIKHYAISFR